MEILKKFRSSFDNILCQLSENFWAFLKKFWVSVKKLLTGKIIQILHVCSQESIRNVSTPTVSITVPPLSSQMSSQLELPSLLQLEMEQQSTVVQLTSHIYTLASIIAQQMTSIDRSVTHFYIISFSSIWFK